MKKILRFSTLLLMLLALLMTGAAAETVTYTGTEAMTVGATFNVKHDCGTPHAVCTVTKAATCTTAGAGNGFCDECGAKHVNFTVTIAANKGFHTWSAWSTTVPTCTEDGYKTRYCMNSCGASEQETIAATGHVAGKTFVSQAATCTQNGTTVVQCARCGATLSTTPIPAIGHKYGEWKTTNVPACAESGLENQTCSNCENVNVRILPAAGHVWSEWGKLNDASCLQPEELQRTCKVCGKTESKEGYGGVCGVGDLIVEEQPGCTTEGVKRAYCPTCNRVVREEIIPATGHPSYAYRTLKEATCTEDGVVKAFCTVCGALDDTVPTANPIAEGHKFYQEDVLEPTCVADDLTRWTCLVCGEIKEEVIGKLVDFHDWTPSETVTWEVIKEATCVNSGVQQATCLLCGKTYTYISQPTGEHDWVNQFDVEPTCTESGEGWSVCSVCGLKGLPIVSDPLGHDWGEWEVVQEATCTQYRTIRRDCSRCDEYEGIVEGVKASHTWVNEEILRAATCTQSGSRRATCDVCGKEQTFIDDKLPHPGYVLVIDPEATCTEPGYGRHLCEVCGNEGELPGLIYPALGHNMAMVPAIPATETESGWTYGIRCERCGYWEKLPHPTELDTGITAHETISLDSVNAGTIFDYEGSETGMDPELLAFITTLTSQTDGAEGLTYVTVYRDDDGNIIAYIDSKGDVYLGWDTDFFWFFNINDAFQ